RPLPTAHCVRPTARYAVAGFVRLKALLAFSVLLFAVCALPLALRTTRADSSLITHNSSLRSVLSWSSGDVFVKAFGSNARMLSPYAPFASDQFFDGSTTNALTASKWAATNAGPFTSAFVSGNTAVFATVNGTGSGAGGISVGGIRSEENFTYS